MKRMTLLLVLLVGLAGCATATHRSGNANLALMTRDEINEWIVKGKTTQQEIIDWIGNPTTTSVSSTDAGDFEVWTYSYVESTARVAFGTVKSAANVRSLMITFGQDGTVSNYTFSANTSGMNTMTQ